jgi:hypothetical protein
MTGMPRHTTPVLFAAVLCLAATAHGQSPVPFRENSNQLAPRGSAKAATLPKKIDDHLKLFFSTLAQGKPEIAFFKLFDGTQFMREKALTEGFVQAAQKAGTDYGKIIDYQTVSVRGIGTRLLLVSYFVGYEQKTLRWQFLYAAPLGNEWKLLNLTVDDWRNFLAADPSTAAPPEPVEASLREFFLQIQTAQVLPAFENLLKNSGIKNEPSWIQQFAEQTRKALEEYGKLDYYELYDNRPLGARIHLLTYIAYLESEPLRWQFFYEVGKDGQWKLINVRLDDLLDENVLES